MIMYIRENIYKQLIYNLPHVPPEHGGIIGKENEIISEVYFDFDNSNFNSALYVPNVKKLNKVIVEWRKKGIEFVGVFHSHKIYCSLSHEDMVYINKVMESMPKYIEYLLFPVVIPQYKVCFYKVYRNMTVKKEEIHII